MTSLNVAQCNPIAWTGRLMTRLLHAWKEHPNDVCGSAFAMQLVI